MKTDTNSNPELLPKKIHTPSDGLGPLQILDDDIANARVDAKAVLLPMITGEYAPFQRVCVALLIDLRALMIQSRRVERKRQHRKKQRQSANVSVAQPPTSREIRGVPNIDKLRATRRSLRDLNHDRVKR